MPRVAVEGEKPSLGPPLLRLGVVGEGVRDPGCVVGAGGPYNHLPLTGPLQRMSKLRAVAERPRGQRLNLGPRPIFLAEGHHGTALVFRGRHEEMPRRGKNRRPKADACRQLAAPQRRGFGPASVLGTFKDVNGGCTRSVAVGNRQRLSAAYEQAIAGEGDAPPQPGRAVGRGKPGRLGPSVALLPKDVNGVGGGGSHSEQVSLSVESGAKGVADGAIIGFKEGRFGPASVAALVVNIDATGRVRIPRLANKDPILIDVERATEAGLLGRRPERGGLGRGRGSQNSEAERSAKQEYSFHRV